MISLLLILLTINGVTTMQGESCSDVKYAEFVVSIWYFHEHRCSGSILDRTHILTSGECVNGLSSSLLSIAAGIIELNPRDIQLVPVRSIHLHPDFRGVCRPNGHYWENNIAVLELTKELDWNRTIAAVRLIDTEYNWNPCDICGLFGWDDATVDGVKLLTLRWSDAMIVEDEGSRDLNVYPSTPAECLEDTFQTIVLEDVGIKIIIGALHLGDYGAPVFCRGFAVGLVTGGSRNEDNPPVLLSIHPYLRFIADILQVDEINTPHGNFQHYVAILHDGGYNCGGSIIDSTHIITAAHCVGGKPRASLLVIPGHREFHAESIPSLESSSVHHIHIHPDYLNPREQTEAWTIVRNDIAVLTLRTPLVRSPTINSIPLSDDWTFGKRCQVYRWSRTSTKQKETSIKSMLSSVRILDPDTCKGINPLLDSNRFCTVNLYSLPIAAQGDSGSPIICGGFLVGILSSHTLSRRLAYGPNQAIFFTKVYPYLEFINDAIADTIP